MRRGLTALRRLPIRLKLTLVFLAVMALVLAALGGFLSLHFRSGLDASINQALRTRANEIAGLLSNPRGGPSARRSLREQGESFAQILDTHGQVIDSSVGLARPLLSRAEAARAARGAVFVERHEHARLFAMPSNHGASIVVVGTSLAEHERALETLNGALLIGGPLALLLASLAGYALTVAAMRPVESMRARAATISASDTGARLPLPESRDEIYRLGSTLNEMLARLEEGREHERAFVADASHELRAPLAVLKGELEVALREDGSREQLRGALQSGVEETDRVVALAEDLLVLARAEQAELQLDARVFSVRELFSRVAERFDHQAQSAGRQVVIDAAPRLALDADSVRLEQAISNLVDNALRYGTGTVRVTAATLDGQIELHVTDDGPGFPPEFLPRAFERFSRADPARSRGGVGLGLAIVEAIARAHGGHATARNRPGGGADVWLALTASARQES
jgi:heavy metal sensor kinase